MNKIQTNVTIKRKKHRAHNESRKKNEPQNKVFIYESFQKIKCKKYMN